MGERSATGARGPGLRAGLCGVGDSGRPPHGRGCRDAGGGVGHARCAGRRSSPRQHRGDPQGQAMPTLRRRAPAARCVTTGPPRRSSSTPSSRRRWLPRRHRSATGRYAPTCTRQPCVSHNGSAIALIVWRIAMPCRLPLAPLPIVVLALLVEVSSVAAAPRSGGDPRGHPDGARMDGVRRRTVGNARPSPSRSTTPIRPGRRSTWR